MDFFLGVILDQNRATAQLVEFLCIGGRRAAFGIAMGEKQFGGALDTRGFFPDQVNLSLPTRAKQTEDFILTRQGTSRGKVESIDLDGLGLPGFFHDP